ncbi:PEP-CTERM sorting domain-containing protein [Aestuariirhabdus sp. Z084]|uniref:PEP-CTERM sorting domain-containing protein n=1 Tax=Aestuariirhabdus haliotis TaxID=2918751 RepID=UPI00201B36C8|nr:PEP-CTERM sorting domain-containing protein [Aestuariirhabdus haliotis]MCL6417497.1 PEP-CTERM sorting domain-containing protein [Aestuariirhabdus haliotis]MCL6421459.1 PEP-CTERM sorting domain-containing protein [Aestuariirhabdus haliotis]
MRNVKFYSGMIFAAGLGFSFSANAAVMTWDFILEIETIYRDDANVINDSYQPGTQLSGSFSYDNGLVENSPDNDYVDRYADPSAVFTVAGLGIYDWAVEVSVVHQSSRDIVDVVGEYHSGNIWEEMEIGFLDYSQSYANGELPTDWHVPPVNLADMDFDYTYDAGTDPCCYDSWLSGRVVSIQLRDTQTIPEPGTLAMFALGLATLVRRQYRR